MPVRETACPVHEVKAALRDIRPTIWREILLRSDVTLARLHGIIQVLMGWRDGHYHQYEIGGVIHAPEDQESAHFDETESVDVELSSVFAARRRNIVYEYDFGDGWQLDIELVDVLPETTQKWDAVCITGGRRGPPEDSGGPLGYQKLLDILEQPWHPEYRQMKRWVGKGFDPEQFDLDVINREIEGSQRD